MTNSLKSCSATASHGTGSVTAPTKITHNNTLRIDGRTMRLSRTSLYRSSFTTSPRVERCTRVELGQFFNTTLKLFYLVAEFLGFVTIGGKLVFEFMKACLLALFVHLGFADVLGLLNLVHVALRQFGHVERIIYLFSVYPHHTLRVDAGLFERIQYFVLVFQ